MPPGEGQTHTRSFPWWSHITHPGPNSRFATNMCLFKLFSVSGQVLRADSWDLHGISFIPGPCWYFHGRVWKTLPSTLPTSNPSCGSDTWMTPLWFGHMAETHSRIFYNISTSNTRASSSPWKQKKTTRSRSLMLAFPETQTAPYTTTSTESPRTQISTWTSDASIIQASSHRSTVHSYNAPTTFVTRTAFPRNYSTSELPSNATVTIPTRSAQRSRFQTPKAR